MKDLKPDGKGEVMPGLLIKTITIDMDREIQVLDHGDRVEVRVCAIQLTKKGKNTMPTKQGLTLDKAKAYELLNALAKATRAKGYKP